MSVRRTCRNEGAALPLRTVSVSSGTPARDLPGEGVGSAAGLLKQDANLRSGAYGAGSHDLPYAEQRTDGVALGIPRVAERGAIWAAAEAAALPVAEGVWGRVTCAPPRSRTPRTMSQKFLCMKLLLESPEGREPEIRGQQVRRSRASALIWRR